MIPLRSVKISGHVYNLAVKYEATENTYSKNSSVIPKKFSLYRSCIKSSIEVLKYNLIHHIWAQNNPYKFLLQLSILIIQFHLVVSTILQSERNFFL